MELEKILEKMPSKLSGALKPYDGATWGMHWNGHAEDVVYGETENYKVVVAKWDQHDWNDGGGGIQWTEWLSVYFTKKGTEDLHVLVPKKIVTRDMHDPHKDLNYLMGFNYAGLEAKEGDDVTVYWKNEAGEIGEGTSHTYSLDDELNRIESEK